MTNDDKWKQIMLSSLEQERRRIFDEVCARIGCDGRRVSRLFLDIIFEEPEWKRLTKEIESLKK